MTKPREKTREEVTAEIEDGKMKIRHVADVKSLVIHPATTTHSQCTDEELADQGIKPNTLRLSIGTENVTDIIHAIKVSLFHHDPDGLLPSY